MPSLALPVEAPQATTASAFSPSPGPHAAGSPPPHSSRPPPWLSGSAAVLAAGGLGDRAPSSPPPLPPARPILAPHCRSDHVVGDFHRGSGGGPMVRSATGAGRVGGVKVGAQENPPPLSEEPDLRCDLYTGGCARHRRDVAQSSPDAPQHIPGPPVEVSLHPGIREPSVPSRLPGPPGFLEHSSRFAKDCPESQASIVPCPLEACYPLWAPL